MESKREIFERVITHSFSHDAFVSFAKEFFTGLHLVAPNVQNKVYSSFNNYVEHYCHIGNYVGKDNEKVAVIAVCLKNEDMVNRSRGIQRNFVKQLMDSGNCAGAFVAFYTLGDLNKWRLSFVRLDYEFSKGKISEKLTPAKRFSYLVGEKEPCHTAMERLFPIFSDDAQNPGLDELEDAFSVEKVTKEFYEQYKAKYLSLIEYLEGNEQFMQEAEYRGFTSEQFAKKLMGQIVFLYFIQKKGWLGVNAIPTSLSEKDYKNAMFSKGQKSRTIIPTIYEADGTGYYRLNFSKFQALSDDDETIVANCVKGRPWGTGPKDFMRQIFKVCEDTGKNYFDDYLEPLFYSALNKNRGENAYFPPLHRRIPFLNGGLFEQLDNYDWENNDFNIPNEIFSNESTKGKRDADGILDIFDRYNFTMNEDEPLECEVAIDPEMLGKVFENLLDVKDRKSKGAFYTPREIVHYMCQETLINYLVTKTNIDEDDIRDFVLYGDLMKDEDTTKDAREGNKEMLISESIFSIKSGVNRIKEIDDLLANVKVADLAVGSGAFPLGMLNEIVKARETLTAYMAIGTNGFNKKILYSDRKPYFLKVNTIKNCIFACDIEPSAVDISKLRLWLSIVIDDELVERVTDNGMFDEHTKPRQLPNLDCNIICGNSLIDEFRGNKLISESDILRNMNIGTQLSVFQSGVDSLLSELSTLQDKLFFVKEHSEKEEIKDRIKDLYDQIVLEQGIKNNPELAEAYYEASRSASLPFIIWQLYFPGVFRNNGGFDIVIGNPPYVGESGHKDIFRPVAATEFGEKYYQGKMDFFYFFFHKGIDLLREDGELALITTNYFPTATGAKKLRLDMKNRTIIRKLINFNEVKVFESAQGQHNMITFLKKTDGESDVLCEGIMCQEAFLASSSQIRDILCGIDKNVTVTRVDQSNIFDGEECYIRIGGVNATSENSPESVLEKMTKMSSQTLGDIAEVNQGVLTGCDTLTNKHLEKLSKDTQKMKNDGIFVLDFENTRDREVYDSFDKGKELCKDFYKNSDIRKYVSSCKPTKKLIYYSGQLDIDKFPDVYSHMLEFKPILEERLVTYNEKYHWTAIHRPRNGKVFENGIPKLVVPYRTKTNAFAYNENEWFCRSDCYVITMKSCDFGIKALLALLNSDSYFFWLYHRGKRKGEVLELFQKPLSEIPIPALSDKCREELSYYSDLILKALANDLGADISEYEKAINKVVFNIFQFTEQEIEIIKEVGGKENV